MTELEELKEENDRLKKELKAAQDKSWEEEFQKNTIGWAIDHNDGYQKSW